MVRPWFSGEDVGRVLFDVIFGGDDMVSLGVVSGSCLVM